MSTAALEHPVDLTVLSVVRSLKLAMTMALSFLLYRTARTLAHTIKRSPYQIAVEVAVVINRV